MSNRDCRKIHGKSAKAKDPKRRAHTHTHITTRGGWRRCTRICHNRARTHIHTHIYIMIYANNRVYVGSNVTVKRDSAICCVSPDITNTVISAHRAVASRQYNREDRNCFSNQSIGRRRRRLVGSPRRRRHQDGKLRCVRATCARPLDERWLNGARRVRGCAVVCEKGEFIA